MRLFIKCIMWLCLGCFCLSFICGGKFSNAENFILLGGLCAIYLKM